VPAPETLSTYATRCLADGREEVHGPIRAGSADQVLGAARDAGRHVVMLYKLAPVPDPYFLPLFSRPYLPPPEVVRVPRFGESSHALGRCLPWTRLRELVRKGLLDGRLGWRWVEIERGALIRQVVRDAIPWFFEFLKEPPPQPTPRHGSRERFASLARVDLPYVHVPAEECRRILPDVEAARLVVLPWRVTPDAIEVLSAFDDATERIEKVTQRKVVLLRCADEPREHDHRVFAVSLRHYSAQHRAEKRHESLELEKISHPSNSDVAATERLRSVTGRELALPGVVPARFDPVLDLADPSRMRFRSGLQSDLREAIRQGARGLRWSMGTRLGWTEALGVEPADARSCFGRSLTPGWIALVACAAGISPYAPPSPVEAWSSFGIAGVLWRTRARLGMSESGETLELEWSRGDFS